MRISDWSSDVCSSDLDLARDRRVAVTEAFTQCRERRGEAGATFVEDERGAHRSDLGNRGGAGAGLGGEETEERSEEHTSELQSLMRISYAVFCLKKKNNKPRHRQKDILTTT